MAETGFHVELLQTCAGPSEMRDRAVLLREGDVNISPSRAAWRKSSSERARDALDEDERYFLRQSLSTPCLTQIVRAEGAALIDIDGRRIFDFHGNSVHQLGHGHPKVIAAIRREMETLPFCPRRYANATATALARRLVETAPAGLDKVLFAPSGAAAIGMALKLARYATRRHKTLSLWELVPRRQPRHDRHRRRGSVPARARPDGAGR